MARIEPKGMYSRQVYRIATVWRPVLAGHFVNKPGETFLSRAGSFLTGKQADQLLPGRKGA
ncbi:hypothetical protein EZJ58_3948 [Sodalis ligni]|uniref:Uncharacterized protein n=1 Tax=Sodalis ligni TaxID=2697027 RepID=A0A4R1NE55_9GAMM|nr:hypothetical protein EZJ58_3948 [Sodalis ligni]